MSAQIISNRYQLLQRLGEGGFGHTFLAVDLHLPTKPQCVVKKLQPKDRDQENLVLASRLFEQEAEVQDRLGSHPNIPTLLAHFEFEGEFYLVQELIVGETLDQELKQGKKYNEAEAIYLLDQILETLSFVHQQNVIHRDIKPTNLIRRGSDGKVFLIDFGAVKQVHFNPFKNAASFHSTVAIGSAGYIPSEQAAGRPCFASDLYALGLVAIETLTLTHPLQLPQNQNTGEFVWQHKTVLRPEVMSFIAKLVRYDYRQRWFSAKEALATFQVIRTSLGYQKKVEPPRILEAAQPVIKPPVRQPQKVQPQVIQPQPLQPVPPVHSEATRDNVNMSVATAPKLEEPPQMPTIVQFTGSNHPNRFNSSKSNVSFWDSNMKVGILITVGVLAFSLLAVLVAVGSLNSIKNKLEQDRAREFKKGFPEDQINPSAAQNVAYDEAIKIGIEAEQLSMTAQTRSEWQEVARKYQRAEMLLKSIDPSDPISNLANQKIADYQKGAEIAFIKATQSPNTMPVTIPNTSTDPTLTSSSPYPTVRPSSTPYYSSNPSYSSYPAQSTSTPAPAIKKARMPGKRKEKFYLAFSSSTGDYIGGAQDKVFTDRDGNFSAQINYHNGLSIRYDGGPDTWHLDFAAPQKMQLTTGSYKGSQRFPFQSPTRPGFDFSGSGRGCNESSGSFNINNIIYSPQEKIITLLDATFVQHCGTSGTSVLMGRIYYDMR